MSRLRRSPMVNKLSESNLFFRIYLCWLLEAYRVEDNVFIYSVDGATCEVHIHFDVDEARLRDEVFDDLHAIAAWLAGEISRNLPNSLSGRHINVRNKFVRPYVDISRRG